MPTAERRKQPRPVSTEDDLARFHASVAGGNHFPTTTRRPRTRANTGSDLAHARETTREKRRTERPRGAQSAETKGVALARRICEVPPRLAYRADVKKPETSSGFWNWWSSRLLFRNVLSSPILPDRRHADNIQCLRRDSQPLLMLLG